jgi:hypothetical protein
MASLRLSLVGETQFTPQRYRLLAGRLGRADTRNKDSFE